MLDILTPAIVYSWSAPVAFGFFVPFFFVMNPSMVLQGDLSLLYGLAHLLVRDGLIGIARVARLVDFQRGR